MAIRSPGNSASEVLNPLIALAGERRPRMSLRHSAGRANRAPPGASCRIRTHHRHLAATRWAPGVALLFVSRRVATPMCPLRPGDPCGLCVPGADGPHNCPTVRLVLEDPEMREMWLAKKAEKRATAK